MGGRTLTLIVGDTRVDSSLCIRSSKPRQEPVPPDSTTWPKSTFQRARLQELTLRKAVMWMPRLFLPGGTGRTENVGGGPPASAPRAVGTHLPHPPTARPACARHGRGTPR